MWWQYGVKTYSREFPYARKAGKYHAGWQKSLFQKLFPRSCGPHLSSEPIPTAKPVRALQPISPLSAGPLHLDVGGRAIQKRQSFQTPCVAGAQALPPLSFPVCLDRWSGNKYQACIIAINEAGFVNLWGICCELFHTPASFQKIRHHHKLWKVCTPPCLNSLGFPIAFEKK